MIAPGCLIAMIWTAALAAPGGGLRDLRVEVPPGATFPGEPIPMAVIVTAGGEPPSVRWPSPPGALIVPGAMELRPLSATAIGGTRNEINRYRFPAWVVPTREGVFILPPISLRLDGAEVRTSSTRFSVKPLPAGRPSTFRGGIGPIRVRASVTPSSVRVGQDVLYELTIEGPAAWGSSADPLGPSSIPSRLERASNRATITRFRPNPPSRLFQMRLRATAPGSVTIPPVLISTFDPSSGRYPTTAGPSVALVIADVPALTSSALILPESRSAQPGFFPRPGPLVVIASGWFLAIGGTLVSLAIRRRCGSGPVARSMRSELDQLRKVALKESTAQARAVVLSFERLALAIDPARGVGPLGPNEFRELVRSILVDDELADRGASLIVEAERVSHAAKAGESADLAHRAVTLLAHMGQGLRGGRLVVSGDRHHQRRAMSLRPWEAIRARTSPTVFASAPEPDQRT
jgi:hypothetical protein